MRKKNRKIDDSEAVQLLQNCEYGILSTVGENGYAYGVPLSYVYIDNSIYFHCAVEGQKLDNIKNNDKISFCVVGRTQVVPKEFSTIYESVIVFGKAIEVNGDEKNRALLSIVDKYSNEYLQEGKEYIEKVSNRTKVIKINIEHITGKARR